MKMRYLVLASLLLAIITIGAASASDNVTDDALAVDDEIDDSIEQVDESIVEDDETILAAGEDDAVGYDEDDFYCVVSEDAVPDSPAVRIQKFSDSLQGSFKILVNDTLKIEEDAQSGFMDYMMDDLGVTSPGLYKIDIYFNDTLLKSAICHYAAYSIDAYVQSEGYTPEGVLYIQVSGPEDYKGKVTVEINGQSYDVEMEDRGYGFTTVRDRGLNLGMHTAVVRFLGDDNYPQEYFKTTFEYGPKLTCPSAVSVDAGEYITLTAPSGTVGTVQLRISDEDYGIYILDKNVNFSNGIASFSLSSLPVGNYWLSAYSYIGNDTFYAENEFSIIKNNPKISASLAKSEITVGDYLTVNINAPQYSVFNILVDEIMIKQVFMTDDKLSELVSGLSLGKHKVRVVAYRDAYVKAFDVTVKEKAPVKKDTVKLTLTKVKVKKSAKKLILKATLKINGKAKKGLKVKFKFGKKSYTAKTNSKGLAKVTVKKSVLKKLKVGKKVTYKATYGKTVKKVTVKVKK